MKGAWLIQMARDSPLTSFETMARKERISRGKTMSPNYFVFCEGDTEVAYTEMLRAHYRLPIHIIAKKTLLNIPPVSISTLSLDSR